MQINPDQVKLAVIVLTKNESMHLERCLISVRDIAYSIYVVDSGSTDDTLEIAKANGGLVISNAWVNHATQFNWALSQLDTNIDWVLRIDADEYLTPELVSDFKACLSVVSPEIEGIYCCRRMKFQGRLIRHGGVFPIRVLRLFRYGKGECENRWMDEHIKVAGPTLGVQGEIIDDNLKPLTLWTEKHNHYASREAVDLLNLEYHFMPHDSVASLRRGKQDGVKRWLKEKVYARLPSGFRAFAYFFYRYVVRMGFLDGQAGTAFHFLQGFWYRYLVDAKVTEVRRYMRENGVGIQCAIQHVLGIKV